MEESLLMQSALFRGISLEEAAAVLQCLQAVERSYPKGALICRQGEPVQAAGLLLFDVRAEMLSHLSFLTFFRYIRTHGAFLLF